MSTEQYTRPADGTAPAPGRRPGLILAWLAIGAVASAALGAAFTPLILLLVPAGVAGVVLLVRTGVRRETFALLSGLALLPLVLAWLNRSGPGPVCTGTVDSDSCTDAANPWPWLVIGLLLLVVGLVAAGRRPRR